MRKWEMHCPAYPTPPHDVPSRGTNKRLHGKHIVRGYLPLLTAYAPLQTEPMKAVVAKYFSWVLLSHGRESKSRCCTILGTKPCTCWKQLAPPRSCRCTKGAWSTRRSRRIQRTGPRWLPSDRYARVAAMGVDACHIITGSHRILLIWYFGVHLPVIYGKAIQNVLGRLLQEIITRSGEITALKIVRV